VYPCKINWAKGRGNVAKKKKKPASRDFILMGLNLHKYRMNLPQKKERKKERKKRLEKFKGENGTYE
jgi:hypothetical protein